MIKKLLTILTLLLPSLALAQHTTVTAQVKDPLGQIYRTCTGSANFVGQNTTPGSGPYLLNGSVFQTTAAIQCDSSARFTISLADNNQISPTPSQWNFSICSALGVYTGPPICFNGLVTITGASQDITAQLQAVAAPLPPYTVKLETNGIPNGSQSLLNLIAGSNITIVDNGVGGVTISSTGGGGGGGGPAGLPDPGANGLVLRTALNTTAATSFGGVGTVLNGTGTSNAPVFRAKPIYDVTDYGVAQNGSTDDTVAVQALLNNVIGSNGATVVFSGVSKQESVIYPPNVTLQFNQGAQLSPISSSTPPGGATFIQSQTNANVSSSTCSVTLGGVTAGNTLVFMDSHFFTGAIIPAGSVTDGGDAFINPIQQGFNFSTVKSGWIASNVRGGNTTVTINLTTAVANSCALAEFGGMGQVVGMAAGIADVESAGWANTYMQSPGVQVPGPLTAPVGALIIGFGGQEWQPVTCTAGTGYVQPAGSAGQIQGGVQGGTGYQSSFCWEYQLSSAGGSTTVKQNISSAINSPCPCPPGLNRYWSYTAMALIPSSAIINIQGPVNAGNQQIFANAFASQGTIDFSSNTKIQVIYPEWWGASSGGNATTNTSAIQAAIVGAYGSNRINGSQQNVYDRELHFSGLYSINGTLNGNHMNGFNWTCSQRLACGLIQTATNTPILQTTTGGTYGAFHKINWSTTATQNLASPLVDLNYTAAPGNDLVTQFVDFYENGFGGAGLAQVGVAIARNGGGAQGSNIDFYDNNWVSFNEAGVLIGNTTGGYTPPPVNTQGGINCSVLATNALAINFYNGDIQGSPNWGIENCGGGFVMVDGMSFENGYGTQIGCDLGMRSGAAGDRFIIRGVRTESLCLVTGVGNFEITGSSNLDNAFVPVPGSTPTVPGNFTIIQPSVSNPKGGAYYKISAQAGAFSGLGSVSVPFTAASGTANTLTDSVGGLTVNAWTNWILSILGGTGKNTYCKIASNTATTFTCTTGTFLSVYANVVATSPDNTSTYIVEPDYSTMTTNGGVTFGPVAQIMNVGNANLRDFFVAGLQVNCGPYCVGDISSTRADWFYCSQTNCDPYGGAYEPPSSLAVKVSYSSGGGTGVISNNIQLKNWNAATGTQQPAYPTRAVQTPMGTSTMWWHSGNGIGSKVLDAAIEPDPGTVLGAPNIGCMRLYNDSGTGSPPTLFAWKWCYDGHWEWPGNVIWTTDNASDLGAAGANRPRRVYVGTDFVGPIGATTPNTGAFTTVSSTGAATLGSGVTKLIQTNTASNSDLAGELSFAGVTTGSYSFTGTYTSHPECLAIPQFDIGASNRVWITYTSTTSFTVNFNTAETGSVSYICIGRN